MNQGSDRLLRWFAIIGALSTAFYLIYRFSALATLFVIAMLLSYILDPVVSFLERTQIERLPWLKIPRTAGILLVMSGLIYLVSILVSSVLPIISTQFQQLSSNLTVENLRPAIQQLENAIRQRLDFLDEGFLYQNLNSIISSVLQFDQLQGTLGNVISIFTNLFSAVLVVPFATFFFLKDGTRMRRHTLELIPNSYFETALTIIHQIENRLSTYFKSVLAQSLLVGTLSYILLSIAGLDNALTIGITIGLANTIPYFGPIIGYVVSSIVAVIETGNLTLVDNVLIAVFIVQMTDNLVFQPFLFSRSADMHPVAILFLILIGAEAGGILGMLIAIPVATSLRIMYKQIKWSLDNYRIFNKNYQI